MKTILLPLSLLLALLMMGTASAWYGEEPGSGSPSPSSAAPPSSEASPSSPCAPSFDPPASSPPSADDEQTSSASAGESSPAAETESSAPPESTVTPSPPPQNQSCPEGEEFHQCATPCEPTCDKPNPVCPRVCKPACCQCKNGNARNKQGKCVPKRHCPPQHVECCHPYGPKPCFPCPQGSQCVRQGQGPNFRCVQQRG